MKLYFDFAKEWDSVILAVASYPDRGGLKPLFRNVKVNKENTEQFNNYHCAIMALTEGLNELSKWLKENNTTEEVIISTQHKQILDWLYSRKVGVAYQELFGELMEKMEELSNIVDFRVMKVDKKMNMASQLVALEKRKILESPPKLDFGNKNKAIREALDKASNGDNVVPFDKLKL